MIGRPLDGARVLVLGASGGLGRAISDGAEARGAQLTLVARDPHRLAAIPGAAPRLAVDLRSPDGVDRAVDFASAGGPIDVVINAVGVVAFGPVNELSVDAMEELFLTNTFLPILLARRVLPHMTAGAVIVSISGVIAEQGLAGMAAYGASKAAARGFAEGFAREARRQKVRVLDARPPHTETGLAGRAVEGEAPRMPTGLDPADVAQVILDGVESGVDDLPSSAFSPAS